MKKLPLARLAVAVAGAGLLLSAGAGLSSAEPDLGPLVDSPCTYDQAIAAVHAENPMAAQYLDQSPPNLQFLRVFLASSPDERMQLIRQVENNPGAAEAFPIIQQMFASCHNY